MAGDMEDGAEDMSAEAKDTEDKASQITGRSGMSLIFTPPSKDRLYTVPPNVLSIRFLAIFAGRARLIRDRT